MKVQSLDERAGSESGGILGRGLGARLASASGVVLLLGACEVHVPAPPQAPPPPAAPAQAQVAEGPRPPRLRRFEEAPPPAPAEVREPAPAEPWAQPLPAPAPFSRRFPHRIVHPVPLDNPGASTLNVQGIVQRPDRKCGPRQLAGGHWIHLDCNVHTPVTGAQPAALMAHMIDLWRRGLATGEGATAASPASGAGAAEPTAGATGAAAAPTADSVDHRLDGTEGPVKDQGQVGACTAFSLSSAMDNAIRRQNKGDTMSSLHIWAHYGYPAMHNAADANKGKAIAGWPVWPYDERVACELDSSGQPGDCGPYTPPVQQGAGSKDAKVQAQLKAADAAGQWKVTEYDQIPMDPDSIAAVLASGVDVWGSMDIGRSWLTTTTDTIPDWNILTTDGGHAIVFAGYRHKNGQRQFLVHNSWGSQWADHGYAYVSDAMVRQFIKNAYKVVVSSTAAPPPAPKGDPSALTDDDCAANQLVDSVTGQCAKICPDDSRPADGKCPAATTPQPAPTTGGTAAPQPPPRRGRRW